MRYAATLLHVLRLFELETPEKLMDIITETKMTLEMAMFNEKNSSKDVNKALASIVRCRAEIEPLFKEGTERGPFYDASAWVLFKICENKSPFQKTASEDDGIRQEFIIMAHLVMEIILQDEQTYPCDKDFTASLPKIVDPESSLGQIMMWSGQKDKVETTPLSEDTGRENGCGTWRDLKRVTTIPVFLPANVRPLVLFRDTLHSLVSLALAMLGVSAIPEPLNRRWPENEQANIFWPGILNVTWMRNHMNRQPLYAPELGRFESGHLGVHSFLVMVDDKWERLTVYHDSRVHHEWRYVRTGIPEVMMKSLDLKTLSSTYPRNWLLEDSFVF
jgi:hypothetical protein